MSLSSSRTSWAGPARFWRGLFRAGGVRTLSGEPAAQAAYTRAAPDGALLGAIHPLALVLPTLGSFLVSMDVSVTNAPQPAIRSDFGGAGTGAISWRLSSPHRRDSPHLSASPPRLTCRETRRSRCPVALATADFPSPSSSSAATSTRHSWCGPGTSTSKSPNGICATHRSKTGTRTSPRHRRSRAAAPGIRLAAKHMGGYPSEAPDGALGD